MGYPIISTVLGKKSVSRSKLKKYLSGENLYSPVIDGLSYLVRSFQVIGLFSSRFFFYLFDLCPLISLFSFKESLKLFPESKGFLTREVIDCSTYSY